MEPNEHLRLPPALMGEAADPPLRGELRYLGEPLTPDVRAGAIYSRSDGFVSWRACLDPCARQVEVGSSHTGMSVSLAVYRVLAEILREEPAWSG